MQKCCSSIEVYGRLPFASEWRVDGVVPRELVVRRSSLLIPAHGALINLTHIKMLISLTPILWHCSERRENKIYEKKNKTKSPLLFILCFIVPVKRLPSLSTTPRLSKNTNTYQPATQDDPAIYNTSTLYLYPINRNRHNIIIKHTVCSESNIFKCIVIPIKLSIQHTFFIKTVSSYLNKIWIFYICKSYNNIMITISKPVKNVYFLFL